MASMMHQRCGTRANGRAEPSLSAVSAAGALGFFEFVGTPWARSSVEEC